MPSCAICQFRKTKFFHKIDRYAYYQCSRCITLFLYPKPTLRQIANYYKKSFKYLAGETNEKLIRARAKLILNNLNKINPVGKNLLDIGSGYGYFLDEADKIGLNTEGIEPAKALYSASINRLIEADIKNCSFAEYFKLKPKKKFDFITIIHTIEHLLNPQETIFEAIKLLNSGGILYIETPNLNSNLFTAEKQNYTFLTPPDHIWLFSLKSFHYLLRNYKNVACLKTSTYSYPEHFMGIIKHILSKKGFLSHPEFISGSDFKKLQLLKQVRYDKKKNLKSIKYLLIDKFFAPLLTPILNLGIYGSILELYIKKK